MGANYSYSRALIYISATDVTAIFAATPALVYILSFLLLAEPFLWLRMLAVTMTVAGVILVAMAERLEHLNPAGVGLTVAASVCAALYKVRAS
jgi:drug/metabolite transporter (DMT)-like permease